MSQGSCGIRFTPNLVTLLTCYIDLITGAENAKEFLEQRLGQTCAWCGKAIGKDEHVQRLSASTRPDVAVASVRGNYIAFPLTSGKIVPAIVSTEGPEGKRDGLDLIFKTCSRKCTQKLKTALEMEKEWLTAVTTLITE